MDVGVSKASDFNVKMFERLHKIMESLIKRFSKHGNKTFYDTNDFPWAMHIEENYPIIKKELDALMLAGLEDVPTFQQVSPEQMYITRDDKWKTFFLYVSGQKSEKNCAKFPETAKLMQSIPGMKSAMFSILQPGKEIPEHRGPYNGILRYHLGMIIPDPKDQCAIIVGGDKRNWDNGKSLIFDDTFIHEAWNKTDSIRVVLFVDFDRPLPWPFSAMNQKMIKYITQSPYVKRMLENLGIDK